MQKSPLFEFDPEIERTLHKLKRQSAQLTESNSEMAGGEEAQRRTLWAMSLQESMLRHRA